MHDLVTTAGCGLEQQAPYIPPFIISGSVVAPLSKSRVGVALLPAHKIYRSPADAPYFTALESMTGGIHVIAFVNYFLTVAPPNPHFLILSSIQG